jgi:outer membrane protein OmpA-like peptidoglycan-associated protein
MKALQADSTELRDILKDYPDYKLTIEGQCDDRGSAEYNVGLGDRRAAAAKDYLVGVGIPAPQLDVISYGKERPVCQEHDEPELSLENWQQIPALPIRFCVHMGQIRRSHQHASFCKDIEEGSEM